MKALIIQAIKFGITGIFNSVLSYAIYLGIYILGGHYLACEFIAFLVTIATSYFLNSRYVFKVDKVSVKEAMVRLLKTYISYLTTGFLLNAVLLIVWIEVFKIEGKIAPLISLLITVPINFLLNKFWVYRKHEKNRNENFSK